MQALDPDGIYTDAEVRDALTAQRGARALVYRFDRLDADNRVIETDVDGILSASVENNALAEIKRTAKFTVADTTGIDFASERIRPRARLIMPAADETSSATVYAYVEDPSDPGTLIEGSA